MENTDGWEKQYIESSPHFFFVFSRLYSQINSASTNEMQKEGKKEKGIFRHVTYRIFHFLY